MLILHVAVHELNASWGAETFLSRAFEALGHEVIRLDYRKWRAEFRERLLAARAMAPDVVLIQRGEGIDPDELAMFEVPKVYFATERASNPEQRVLIRSGVFDAIAAASRSTFNDAVERLGVPPESVRHLPSAFDPSTYFRQDCPKIHNVAAAFTLTPRRRRAFSALGIGIRRKRKFQNLFGLECNRVVNASAIVLNIHATDTLDTETRLYELLPTSAAIVSEECDAPELFAGGGIFWFRKGDWGDMRQIVKGLIRDPDLRMESVKRNNAIAHRHTWGCRAESFVALFETLLNRQHA